MDPHSECDVGEDGVLTCQSKLLELSKPSNFGGNINNWNQKKSSNAEQAGVGCSISPAWFGSKSSESIGPQSACNGGDDGVLRSQFKFLELSKISSNFG
jgi:hypothetical protein